MTSLAAHGALAGPSLMPSPDLYQALWDLEGPALNEWIRTVPVLFPKAIVSKSDDDLDSVKANQAKLVLASQVWTHLRTALQELEVLEEPIPEVEQDDQIPDAPPSKRQKTEKKKKKKTVKVTIKDPFNVWMHTIHHDDDEDDNDEDDDDNDDSGINGNDLKTTMGGKLSKLTISGILNGLAGIPDGLVKNKRLTPTLPEMVDSTVVSSLATMNVTFRQLKNVARTFYKALQARMERDVLVTTPVRIQQMLAPHLTAQEFSSVRKRIVDTVVLGKGLAAQVEEEDIPTGAVGGGVHDIEKFKKCKTCGNNDQSVFVLDRKNGDVICSNCGTVASESLMHEGSQFRKFEGEVDRNHHGDSQNPLYSNAHNMSTTLGGIQVTTGAGIGGFGSQKQGLEVVLRNAHAYTELNISQFGKGDRRTRTGYKDKQKRDAFIQMAHCGDALNLHEAVVQRAKELFAGFRDDRELVQEFKGVIAACLCASFDQLSSAGRRILKQQEEDIALKEESDAKGNKVVTSARAHRRNELHHANLAGKGGLLLDYSEMEKDSNGEGHDNRHPKTESTVGDKLCTTWDLDDCRTWLLEASRSIAAQWMEDRKLGTPESQKIPQGSKDELEGLLVQHAITLCDQLEEEIRQKTSAKSGRGRRAVTTPRVNDMAKLGIKWQHSHERGSGGKGGVGNSGSANKAAVMQKSGPSAGQLLILKTAKKLGSMLKDPVSGDAIHQELRTLVGKQDAIKKKDMRDEATRQRLLQMKRKSWLQARVEVQS